MTARANGTFEVQMSPQGPQDKAEGATLGRMSIAKQFHGDLEAVGKGEMLSAMTDVMGSAGYVAIRERLAALFRRDSERFRRERAAALSSASWSQLAPLSLPRSE